MDAMLKNALDVAQGELDQGNRGITESVYDTAILMSLNQIASSSKDAAVDAVGVQAVTKSGPLSGSAQYIDAEVGDLVFRIQRNTGDTMASIYVRTNIQGSTRRILCSMMTPWGTTLQASIQRLSVNYTDWTLIDNEAGYTIGSGYNIQIMDQIQNSMYVIRALIGADVNSPTYANDTGVAAYGIMNVMVMR